ncbi:S-layer homology domain-containing protein, partial [Mycobacterium tuberculosis]|uniref:S-layer homology domain-containing protein n=1 Tax=Mycobacterium tuberculosis TaxID=1773 RepID=UPI001BDFD537
RPSLVINREQAAKMLVNVVGEINATNSSVNFSDSKDIAPWASEDVKIATSLGLIEGYPNGSFLPKGHLTRAEAAVLIYRLIDTVKK